MTTLVRQPQVARLRDVLLVLVGVFGLSASITLIWLGMRAVMDIGGACADGGPFVPVQPCPAGAPAALTLGMLGIFGFGALGIYAGAQSNLIGGSVAARNIISGSGEFGVWLDGSGTNANVVQGNFIGLDVAGAADADEGCEVQPALLRLAQQVAQHVGQPVGPEPDAAGQRVVVGIRDEVHQRRKDRGAGWRGPGQVRALGAAVEDQAETLSKTLDHVVDGRPMVRARG